MRVPLGGRDAKGRCDGSVTESLAPEVRQMDARRFGAAHAIIAYALMIFAQFTLGIVMVVAAMIVEAARGTNVGDPKVSEALTDKLTIPIMIGAILASIVTTLIVTRVWAWHLVRDRSPSGLGLFFPSRMQLLLWMAVGFALGAAYIGLTILVPTQWTGGPLAQTAAGGGTTRAVWAVMSVLIGPPLEEFVYRGLMLRGLLASWGVKWAGILVTVLFFLPYLTQTGAYWPAILAVLGLGCAALAARLLTGSVYAAMAVNFACNASLVVAVYSRG